MKKVLALILAIIMICSTAAMLVYAETDPAPTDWKALTESLGLHVKVAYAEVSPVVDGVIGENEYPTSKEWTPEDIIAYDETLVGDGVTEYFAHDDYFIYYAAEFTQTAANKAFQWQFKPHNSYAIFNAKEPDIDTTLFQRISWQIRMVSYEGEDLWCDGTGSWAPAWNYSGGDWRLPVYNQDLFYAGSKDVDTNKVVYEIKLTKAYVAELNECEIDEVNVISYFTYFHSASCLAHVYTEEDTAAFIAAGATRADAGNLFLFMDLIPKETTAINIKDETEAKWAEVTKAMGTHIYVGGETKNSPVLDGVVNYGEYTASVYNAPETILNYGDGTGEIQSGVTEYFAHDAEWVYYAVEFKQATENNRAFQWQFKPFNTFDIFNGNDDLTEYYYSRISWQARYHTAYADTYKYFNTDYTGSWAPAWNVTDVRVPYIFATAPEGAKDELHCAAGYVTDTQMKTYEVKLAKSYLAEINGCAASEVDVISYFTYFHSAAGVGHIYTEEDITALTAAEAALLPENGAGELGYKFIVLADEIKYPEAAVITLEDEDEIKWANVTKDMGTHIYIGAAGEGKPVVDGVINKGEYATSVYNAPEAIYNYGDGTGELQSGVREYFAHDAENIYYAVEFTQTNDNRAVQWQFKPFNTFDIFNGSDDLTEYYYTRFSWQVRYQTNWHHPLHPNTDYSGSWAPTINGNCVRLPVIFTGLNTDELIAGTVQEELECAATKNLDTNVKVYEYRISKAYLAEVNGCEVEDLMVISYFTYFHSSAALGHVYTEEDIAALTAAEAAFLPENGAGELGYKFIVLADELHVHDYDDGVVTTEPTHTTVGVKTFTCECGDTYTEEVAKTTEHNWGEGVVTTEPTVDAEGVKTYTCECGETKTEAIAKLDPPATTTTTTTTTTAAAKKGCKGAIAISALVIAPVLAGGAVLLKKKED